MTKRSRFRRCWMNDCSTKSIKWGMCQEHLDAWLELRPRQTTEDRFWSYVRKVDGDGCWFWMGALDSNGYGIFNSSSENGKFVEKAHRYSYIVSTGVIIGELQLEPLCRMRPCVRPSHLQPVTSAENNRRKPGYRTSCGKGHQLTEENTHRSANGSRRCIKCREAKKEQKLKERPTEEEIAKKKDEALRKRRLANVPVSGVRGKGQYRAERTHCPKGHPYAGENLLTESRKRSDGTVRKVRKCRICVNTNARDSYVKRATPKG